jgi:ribosomal protein S7
MKIKTKLINLLTTDGKKEVGEKNLIKSLKELQKNSNKKDSEILNLALIYSAPIFKLHRIKNKKIKKNRNKKFKEIPGFIKSQNSRISLAIKFILLSIKNKSETFYKKFNKEILTSAAQNSNTIQIKNELQKNIQTKKHYFRYYRWS